jgi:N6-L-threonylcarbamoyladenine synthase
MTTILGIETSCDETAASIVTDHREIRANIVLSQTTQHVPYGGVVPEIAARAHMEHVQDVVQQALRKAECSFADLDAVAVTGGPGLIGGVIVGVMTAKAIASVHKKPFIAVNHLEGHALTVRLTSDIEFPYLMLLVSGGHCQFLIVHGVGKYTLLGSTVDDALGEAFDKVAKMLGLPQPGGPSVEKMALTGNENAHQFPLPMKGRDGCDLSFSGLKTAVKLAIPGAKIEDICASFQKTAGECLIDRAKNAIALFRKEYPNGKDFVLAGGVAANQKIRAMLSELLTSHDMQLVAPPIALCTDNAAMIAWAGMERFKLGLIDNLGFEPRARWPL